MSSIATFYTIKIIIANNSKFSFVWSILETMYRCVSGKSKVIIEYKKNPILGARDLTLGMQRSIYEDDKPKKGGKKGEKKKGIPGGPSFQLPTPKKRKTQLAAPLVGSQMSFCNFSSSYVKCHI